MSIAKNPHLDTELVREFVGAAHSDVDKVRDMLAAQPELVNATVDVGSDFESALGGAAHMGRADIAEVLLANGARMDIFCAAMMGKIEIVKAFVTDDPGVVHLKGPHGIPLINHAKRGGQNAVVEFLEAHGASA